MSALTWGVGDFSGGIASRLGNVATSIVATQAIGFVATLVLLVAAGEPVPSTAALAWGAAAGAFGVGGLGTFYLALSRGTMGLVAPLTALIGAALPAIVGLVNGAPITPLLLGGIVVALGAIVLISLPDAPSAIEGAERGGRQAEEIALIVVSGLGFSGFYLAIDQASLAGGQVWWPIFMVRLAGLAIAVAVVTGAVALGRAGGHLWVRRSIAPLFLLAGLGDLGGNLFFLLANRSGALPVAVVLSSLYPVVTALLARLFLTERLSGPRLAGVGLAVGGIVLIAAGQL